MAAIAREPDPLAASDQGKSSGLALQPTRPDYVLTRIPVVVHACHRSASPDEARICRAAAVRVNHGTSLIFDRCRAVGNNSAVITPKLSYY